MKTRISKLLSLGLIAPFLLTGAVFAEGTNSGSGSTTSQNTTTSSSNKTETETETETHNGADDKNLANRLQERKSKLKTTVTSTEKLRIQSRCKNSQGKLSSLDGRIKGIQTSREAAYSKITTKLTDLQTKLKAKGVDTAQLDTQIAELNKKIDQYKTDLATYKQAVTDLSAMDCSADPTAFKASLETARAALLTVRQDAVAIKSYVTQTIRPTLQQIKAQLEKDDSTDSTSTKTPSTTGGTQ